MHEVIKNADGSETTVDVVTSPATSIMYGGCPINGSNVDEIDAKYGVKGKIVRIFNSGQLVKPPVTDRLVVGSFKDMTNLDPAVAALFAYLFFQHETNSKMIKAGAAAGPVGSSANLAAQAAYLSAWHASMTKAHSMGIQMSTCVTLYGFTNPASMEQFLRDDVSHWAIDADGISNSHTPYHNIEQTFENAIAFRDKHGLTMGVAEHGADRAVDDTNGDIRAAWIRNNSSMFDESGMLYSCVWEDQKNQPNSLFRGDAEINTIATLFSM